MGSVQYMKKILCNSSRHKKILKKGIRIGVLGTALAAGTVLGTGCPQPSDSTITIPGDNQQGGNSQGGNENQGGNTGNENQGGNTGNPSKYGTPCDQKLGNGNYVIHNFISEDDNILYDTAVEDTNHYLALGKTYLTDQYNQFKKSLEGRPAAQAYFQAYDITAATHYMEVGENVDPGGNNLDRVMNKLHESAGQYFYDMVKNLNSNEERNTFIICYNVMNNQARHFGYGQQRDSDRYLDKYNRVRKINSTLWTGEWPVSESFDMDQDIDQNHFQQITHTTDKLLAQTAKNLNQKYQYDLTANDLRQIMNLSFNAASILAIHDSILPIKTISPTHEEHCGVNAQISTKMEQAADDAWREEQQQNNSLEQSL